MTAPTPYLATWPHPHPIPRLFLHISETLPGLFPPKELAWRAFADLVASLRPLVGLERPEAISSGTATPGWFHTWRDSFRESFRRSFRSILHLGNLGSDETTDRSNADATSRPETEDTCRKSCASCGASPAHTPCMSTCGHIFCYYCLAAALMRDAWARCPCCAARLEVLSPFSLVLFTSRPLRCDCQLMHDAQIEATARASISSPRSVSDVRPLFISATVSSLFRHCLVTVSSLFSSR